MTIHKRVHNLSGFVLNVILYLKQNHDIFYNICSSYFCLERKFTEFFKFVECLCKNFNLRRRSSSGMNKHKTIHIF